MDYFKAHVGNVRQLLHEDEDPETASVTPQLKVPEIVPPADAESTVLYGDVEGSPFSRTPGRISLAEAAEQSSPEGTEAEPKTTPVPVEETVPPPPTTAPAEPDQGGRGSGARRKAD